MDGTFWKVHLSIWDRFESAISFGGRISFIGYIADIRCKHFFDQIEIIQTIIPSSLSPQHQQSSDLASSSGGLFGGRFVAPNHV
jgi:hypothetical protein